MIFLPASGFGLRVEQRLDRGDDLQRLGHAARTRLAAFGHLADVRSDEEDAVLFEGLAVAARGGMRPHFRVHRRRHQHLFIGGEQHGRGKVVGVAVGELGHQVGGGWCDDDQIGLARQADMADIMLVLAVEEVGENVVGGKRADRKRRDELPRGGCHDAADRSAPLAQAADQVERLVGGDAAADDEQDALAGEGHAAVMPTFGLC